MLQLGQHWVRGVFGVEPLRVSGLGCRVWVVLEVMALVFRGLGSGLYWFCFFPQGGELLSLLANTLRVQVPNNHILSQNSPTSPTILNPRPVGTWFIFKSRQLFGPALCGDLQYTQSLNP